MSFPADEHSFQFQHSRSSLAASYDILSQYLQSSVRLSIVTCFYGVQLGKQKGYLSMRNGFRSLDETVQSRRRELRVSCNGFHLKTSKKKSEYCHYLVVFCLVEITGIGSLQPGAITGRC